MKDVSGEFLFNGQTYKIIFNLNVMEEIQEKYGSVAKWGELTDGSKGEVNAKAIIFGYTAMLNEAIDIENEEKGLPSYWSIMSLTQFEKGHTSNDFNKVKVGETLYIE